jgi:hypothetical protein
MVQIHHCPATVSGDARLKREDWLMCKPRALSGLGRESDTCLSEVF